MTKMPKPPSRVAPAVGALVIALSAWGCTVTTTARTRPVVVEDDVVVQAEVVPVDVYSRPRYYYGNRYVYLVDDRWYYPSSRGWVVYRREPVELRRHRVRYYDNYRARRTPEYGYPSPRRDYGYPRQPGRRYYPR
jgi:hypothetical protein